MNNFSTNRGGMQRRIGAFQDTWGRQSTICVPNTEVQNIPPLPGPIGAVPSSYSNGGNPLCQNGVNELAHMIAMQQSNISCLQQECLADAQYIMNITHQLEEEKRKRSSEKIEALSESVLNKSLMLNKGDEQGTLVSSISFMSAIFKTIKGFYNQTGGLGVYIEIESQDSAQSTDVVISSDQLRSDDLVDCCLVPGTRYLVKCSKQHRASLLRSYIMSKIKTEEVEKMRCYVKWYSVGNHLTYADGYRKRPFDDVEMEKKKLLVRDGVLNNPDAILKGVNELLSVFTERAYGALLLMTCVGGFIKSILLRSSWCPRAAIGFCGSRTDIRAIVDEYFVMGESWKSEAISAKSSERDFLQQAEAETDEVFLVDCGEMLVHSTYRERLRIANIQLAVQWGTVKKRKFPLLISQHPVDVCQMDNIIPFVIEPEDICWEVWERVQRQPYLLGDFINLLRFYIESSGFSFQEQTDREINHQYAIAQRKGYEQPELIAVYETLASLLCSVVQSKCIDAEAQKVFENHCLNAVELLKNAVTPQELIKGEFMETVYELIENDKLLVCDISKELQEEPQEGRCLFYDEQYLYFSMKTFKEVVLINMNEHKKNAHKILSCLVQNGIVIAYQDGRDFCVDVMVKWGGRKSRKSVIRFSREVFCSTKRGDLINRGTDYEES